MSTPDLVFRQTPISQPAELVFGEVDVLPDIDITINGTFPAFEVSVTIGLLYEISVAVTFPAFTTAIELDYDSYVDRPLGSTAKASYQEAIDARSGAQSAFTRGKPTRSQAAGQWTEALDLRASFGGAYDESLRLRSGVHDIRHQEALRLGTWATTGRHQDGIHIHRPSIRSRFQQGIRLEAGATDRFQERYRDRRPQLRGRWQEGIDLRTARSDSARSGVPVRLPYIVEYNEGVPPPPGYDVPVEPPFDPCYLPDPALVFFDVAAIDGALLFYCERHGGGGGPKATVIIPIRRVYAVINNISLRRVVGNVPLIAESLSLQIDADSWTWGFSAVLSASMQAVILAVDSPVELEANINGTLYRLYVESMSRDKTFPKTMIRIAGRGKTALLAKPYSPILTFANDEERTAQQLMADVLTFNGIPIGWSVDWQIEDWLVPAGAFNVRGTYIEGLSTVAKAAGAYLQPHPVNQQVSVLHRYPTKPWDWSTVIPDFEVPSSVAIREGVEWIDRPIYNRVFVSGTSQGVLGQVTREGTAGDLPAPMVADALITEAIVARQRGIAILGDTGKQALITLRMPVLEASGVITPGKFVRYTDPAEEFFGIVRSTRIDAGYPETWQSIEIEAHL